MCFTIEPMVNAGKRFVKVLPDGWTVVTKDRSLSAQWEHTILVTETGHEVLTLRNEERDELDDQLAIGFGAIPARCVGAA
jgi:methionyl aminopeptidase